MFVVKCKAARSANERQYSCAGTVNLPNIAAANTVPSIGEFTEKSARQSNRKEYDASRRQYSKEGFKFAENTSNTSAIKSTISAS